jgi:hypothetical protein
MSSPLDRLAAQVASLGGLLAETVQPPPDAAADGRQGLGELAAAGARARARPGEYALLVEAIREGYLEHYGEPRVVVTGDEDLALLAGDRLYALGLARLAELGDLEAVAELADVISLAAQAQAEGDPERAEAVWRGGARAVGCGSSRDHEAAKAAWRGAA